MNWLCTTHKKFLSLEFPNGDNESFNKRGISTFMMQLLWKIGVALCPAIIQRLRLMCQVNSAEDAYKFYKKRSFVEYKNLKKTDFPELFADESYFNSEQGQFISYITEFPDSQPLYFFRVIVIQQVLYRNHYPNHWLIYHYLIIYSPHR